MAKLPPSAPPSAPSSAPSSAPADDSVDEVEESDESAHDADDVSSLSYEQARDELVRVVNELEQGSATLEESLALWERGESLARRCEQWLLGAKERLDAARTAASGTGAQGRSES